MTRVSRLAKGLLVPGLLLFLTLIFSWDALSPGLGEGVWGHDIVRYFYPFGEFTAAALKAGHLPRWNVHLFMGFPFVADPQTSVFYPFTWLLAVWPTEWVISWGVVLHLGLAALGTFVFVRVLGGQASGALLGGVIFAFSGTTTPRIFAGHYAPLMTWAWFPWTLAAFYWAHRRRSLPLAILTGIPIGLGGLAGYPPFWSFTLLAVGLLALYLAFRSMRESGWQEGMFILLQLSLALFTGLMLSGAQLLPSLQLSAQSSRAAQQSYEYAAELSLPVHHLLTLFAPDLFGAPASSVDFWAAPIYFYWEFSLYIGIWPLLLLLIFGSTADWRWRFFLAVGGSALLISLGEKGVLHLLLYRFLPGFGLFRGPTRAYVLFTGSIAVLTALATDRWLTASSEVVKQRLAPFGRGIRLAAILAVSVALLATMVAATQVEDTLSQRALLISSQAIRFLLLLGASYFLLHWCPQFGRLWLPAVAALALLLVDLWGFGAKFLVVEPLEEPQLGWIMADLVLPPERHAYRILPTYHAQEGNDPLYFGFLGTDGYDFFTVGDADVLRDLAHQRNDRILDLLSVRYLMVATEDVPHTPVTGWNVVTQPAGAHFYERDHVGPRAFVVHGFELATDHDDALDRLLAPALDPYATAVLESPADCAWELPPPDAPLETATILGYEQERVTLEVEAAAGGMLILGDLYYPGWQAEGDGQPVPVHKADYALRGVCVSAGRHRVVFTFDPPIVRQGITVSQMGLGVILLAALWATWEAFQARRRFVRKLDS